MLNQKMLDILIGAVLVLCLISLVFIAVPMDFHYIFNFDESMDLTRTHLLSRDYIFFKEVWNDHPLGLPMIFKLGANFFEITLTSARYIILAFSVINILVFYFLLRLEACDRISSIVSILILITCFHYIRLSGLIFKEIPSLSLAILSVFLMSLYARRQGFSRYLYLLLCSISFVMSLQVKLSGVTVIPALIAIGISSKCNLRTKLQDAVAWTVATSLIFIFLSATVLPFSYSHLIGSHGKASAKLAVADPSMTLLSLIKTGVEYDTAYVLLAILAIFSIIWTDRRIRLIPPLLWLGFNLLRFSLISPVWPNYYIHLAIPLAWIIAIFLNDLKIWALPKEFRARNLKSPKLFFQTLLILVTFFQFAFNTAKIVTAQNPRRYRHSALAAANLMAQEYKAHPAETFLQQYQGSNKVILTDNSFLIHRFELDTPPETAILSRKRLVTEDLDGDFILDVIQKRKPDFVLLDRFVGEFMESKTLSTFLEENYTEYPLQYGKAKLFIAKDPSLN